MRVFRKIMAYSLILLIPVAMLCLSANILLRAPDVVQFSLKATEALDKANIYAEEDIVGDTISDFMLHKSSELQLNMSETETDFYFLFSKTDQDAASRLRLITDVSAIAGAVFILATVLIYFYLIRNEFTEILRWLFKRECIILLLFLGISVAAFNVTAVSDFIYAHIFPFKFSEGDAIPMILDRYYARMLLTVGCIVSGIFMTITGYITWKLTKPKRMFFW
ncbi:MAG: hypothetical protein K6F52_08010 [Clostridia bacterium]|nr:hypothetical protein [Clostridia bacterium]